MGSRQTRQLNVTGHIELTVNDQPLTVEADGGTICVSAPRGDPLQQFIRGLPDSLATRRGLAYQARSWRRTGLRLRVAEDQRVLIEMGAGVSTGWFAGLVGLRSVKASPTTLWWLYKLRRRPASS